MKFSPASVPQQFPFGWDKNKSLTFSEMWALVMRVHGNNPFFPPALLIGLFWEETLFTNRRQQGGPAVGLFPLGPGEVFVPAYGYSRVYVERINVTNTVIVNRAVFANVTVANVTYVNRGVAGAVTVPPVARLFRIGPNLGLGPDRFPIALRFRMP